MSHRAATLRAGGCERNAVIYGFVERIRNPLPSPFFTHHQHMEIAKPPAGAAALKAKSTKQRRACGTPATCNAYVSA